MDIVIISQYLRNIENFDENNSRFVYLAKLLTENNDNEIEIITSDFCHGTKKHFDSVGKLNGVSITTLHEKGYPKNVCLKRFSSHKELSRNIRTYLDLRKKPDVVYCAVPSLDVAQKTAKYCEQNHIKYIIDIQDLWPEAFHMVFNIPIISNIIFYPMKKQANYIYSRADKIVAVSETYANRALKNNKNNKKGLVIYLGTDLSVLDKKIANQEITYKKKTEELWLGYLGTIGSSYDIKTTLEATKLVQNEKANVKLVLIGDGPLLKQYKKMADDLNVNAVFLGRKNYYEAMKILQQCDIALNPLVKGAAQSIINKVGDYAALGLPVINSLENDEYRDLLNKFNAGINIQCENSIEMKEKIIELINDKVKGKIMGRNNRKLAEEKFNRNKTYKKIFSLIFDN